MDGLALALERIGRSLEGEAKATAIAAAKERLAVAASPDVAKSFARVIAVMSASDPQGSLFPTVVALLKWPTSAGPATDELLEILRDNAWDRAPPFERSLGGLPIPPGKAAGLKSMVSWIARYHPEIDLDSPPTCPPTVCKGLPRVPGWSDWFQELADPILTYVAATANTIRRALGWPPGTSSPVPPADHSTA